MVNLSFLTEDDWATFEHDYPSAYAFLLGRSRHGELKALRAHQALITSPWRALRLAELEAWARPAPHEEKHRA
jgi:hypothetical protein